MRGQRQRDDLASPQVRFRDRLDVAVERRPSGQLDLQPGRRAEPLADPGQGGRRIVRRDRQEDDVVGGVAVGRDLARAEGVGQDPDDVRRLGHARDRLRGRRLERRAAGGRGVAVEDDHDGRWRVSELGLEERLRPGRLEVVEDEAAGPQDADDPRRQRDRDEQDDRPDEDDRPPPPDGEPAEPGEGIRGAAALGGAPGRGVAPSGSAGTWANPIRPFGEADIAVDSHHSIGGGSGGLSGRDDDRRDRARPAPSRSGHGHVRGLDATALGRGPCRRDRPRPAAQHVAVFVPDADGAGLRLAAQVWGAGEDTGAVVVGEWVVPLDGSVLRPGLPDRARGAVHRRHAWTRTTGRSRAAGRVRR